MFFQQESEFLLECHLAMVDLLGCDVANNRFLGRLAHRESTIAGLPAEMAMTFVFYDLRRAGFEIFLPSRRGISFWRARQGCGHDLQRRRPAALRIPDLARLPLNRRAPPIGNRVIAEMRYGFC